MGAERAVALMEPPRSRDAARASPFSYPRIFSLMTMKSYTGLSAASYDLWFGEGFEDVDFFRDAIRGGGEPALEVACGTGRLLVPFAQEGLDVEGLDLSAEMLGICRWKAEAEGILEEVLGHLDYNILSTLKLNGFERNDIINDTWMAAYRAPFPTPGHAAGAIGWAKGFATGAHEFETPDAATAAALA